MHITFMDTLKPIDYRSRLANQSKILNIRILHKSIKEAIMQFSISSHILHHSYLEPVGKILDVLANRLLKCKVNGYSWAGFDDAGIIKIT